MTLSEKFLETKSELLDEITSCKSFKFQNGRDNFNKIDIKLNDFTMSLSDLSNRQNSFALSLKTLSSSIEYLTASVHELPSQAQPIIPSDFMDKIIELRRNMSFMEEDISKLK
jgi:hypothetical protein